LNPNVLLWALKPPEDRPPRDIVIRLWNQMSSQQTFSLSINGVFINSVARLSHIETPVGWLALVNGELRDTLASQQIRTYALSNNRKTFLPFTRRR
jgi:hypothetical protein